MRPNSQEAEYARKLAAAKAETEKAKQVEADILASAKDAGLNVRAIGRAAAELRMDPDKRAKRYEDEDQLDWLRGELGLTATPTRIAAE